MAPSKPNFQHVGRSGAVVIFLITALYPCDGEDAYYDGKRTSGTDLIVASIKALCPSGRLGPEDDNS